MGDLQQVFIALAETEDVHHLGDGVHQAVVAADQGVGERGGCAVAYAGAFSAGSGPGHGATFAAGPAPETIDIGVACGGDVVVAEQTRLLLVRRQTLFGTVENVFVAAGRQSLHRVELRIEAAVGWRNRRYLAAVILRRTVIATVLPEVILGGAIPDGAFPRGITRHFLRLEGHVGELADHRYGDEHQQHATGNHDHELGHRLSTDAMGHAGAFHCSVSSMPALTLSSTLPLISLITGLATGAITGGNFSR